jgi:hypothetical protein
LKPIYTIFSRVIFLNIIAGFLILVTLQFAIIGSINLYKNEIDYFGIVVFLLLLVLNFWLLTCTFLPFIKINDGGIYAYSIFWRRHLTWDEIKFAKLVKCYNRHSTGHSAISFEETKIPETKPYAFTNKGVRINTFIFVSCKNIKNPESLLLGGQLLSHKKITKKDEIAFAFEKRAWQLIEKYINKFNTV